MTITGFFKHLFQRTVAWFRAEAPRSPTPSAPANPLANLLAAGLTPPVDVPLPEPASNRAQRRAASAEYRRLERARLRKDKFIEPQGPQPKPRDPSLDPPQPKPERQPQPELAASSDDPIIADAHHTDGETVLYKPTEFFGEFNFRDTILDQLERYFFYLRRMRARDPDAYGFLKEIGATLLPYPAIHIDGPHKQFGVNDGKWDNKELPPLPPFFHAHRPGFGAFVYGANPYHEREETDRTLWPEQWQDKWELMVPKFMYFHKYEQPPPEVQMKRGGDIYAMTIWWDLPHGKNKGWKKGGTPDEFAIFISCDGKTIQALRVIDTKLITVRARHRDRGRTFIVPQRGWHIPTTYKQSAHRHGVDVQTYLCGLFLQAIRSFEHSNFSMTRITVKKNDMIAVFSVDPHRLSYFFKDRDIELTENGVKKRIFHVVRPHVRSDGTTVAMHFRGAREFHWADYAVKITVPGADHFMLPECSIGSVDERMTEKGDFVSNAKFGRILAKAIDRGVGGRKH